MLQKKCWDNYIRNSLLMGPVCWTCHNKGWLYLPCSQVRALNDLDVSVPLFVDNLIASIYTHKSKLHWKLLYMFILNIIFHLILYNRTWSIPTHSPTPLKSIFLLVTSFQFLVCLFVLLFVYEKYYIADIVLILKLFQHFCPMFHEVH